MKNIKNNTIKVLSIKQPWAYLICSGIKDVENRTWRCPQKYIGERVLIHACGKPDSIKYDIEGQATVDEIKLFSALNYCDENELYFAIIGSVRFVDCVIDHPSIWAEKNKVKWVGEKASLYREWFGEKLIYNWVVAEPVLFDKPILNVKGKLGFWNYNLKEKNYE